LAVLLLLLGYLGGAVGGVGLDVWRRGRISRSFVIAVLFGLGQFDRLLAVAIRKVGLDGGVAFPVTLVRFKLGLDVEFGHDGSEGKGEREKEGRRRQMEGRVGKKFVLDCVGYIFSVRRRLDR
jgi:hypothetical protein